MRYLASILFVALLITACGASRQGPTVTSPFSERDATLFDDGVDMMADPDSLHGQWREDWEVELSERIERSDAIFEGELTSVQVDSDPDKRKSYRAVISVVRIYKGDLYGAKEVALISREGALGYASIANDPERILRHSFMAFVKYAESPSGAKAPIAHFHVALPSLAMRRGLVGEGAKKPRTVKVESSSSVTGAAP